VLYTFVYQLVIIPIKLFIHSFIHTGYSTPSLRTVAQLYIKIMIILYSAKTDFKISLRLVNFSELFMRLSGQNISIIYAVFKIGEDYQRRAVSVGGLFAMVDVPRRAVSVVGLFAMVDVPRRDSVVPDNATLYSDSLSNKNLPRDAVRGLVEPSHVHRGDSGDGEAQSLGIVFLGATVGVAIVLAALLVAVVVCFMMASRRRRGKRMAKRADDAADVGRPLPLPPINGNIETLERRAPNNHYVSTSSLQQRAATPQQPVPPIRKDSRASNVQVSAAASPKPYRTAAAAGVGGPECSCATLPVMTAGARTCPPAACSSTFHTMMTPATAVGIDDARYLAQRCAAWDAILQRQGGTDPASAMLLPAPVHDIPDPAERPISMSELPPPPDFLLENAGPEVQLGGGALKNGGKIFDGRLAAASPLLFEMTDGYRSADSVDDDIDDVDYTIRQPSVHGHLQYA